VDLRSRDTPRAVTPEKLEAAARRLVDVARPRKIILFGSCVTGRVGRNSDLDGLVETADALGNPWSAS
jgi:predicted nucleotidyltransferase